MRKSIFLCILLLVLPLSAVFAFTNKFQVSYDSSVQVFVRFYAYKDENYENVRESCDNIVIAEDHTEVYPFTMWTYCNTGNSYKLSVTLSSMRNGENNVITYSMAISQVEGKAQNGNGNGNGNKIVTISRTSMRSDGENKSDITFTDKADILNKFKCDVSVSAEDWENAGLCGTYSGTVSVSLSAN